MATEYILEINNLKTQFVVRRRRVVRAVDGVTFKVRRGKILGLVGESGCGKSVTAHGIMRLLPKTAVIPEGSILFQPEGGESVDMAKLNPTGRKIRSIRGNEISMIFQDPMASLNPVYNIGDQIIEVLREHSKITKKEALERAVRMLELLSIPKASERIKDYPHQFSGGMKQRVMIAMGLICRPQLLIADEPTTALDVTIQAQIIELIKEMQSEFGFSTIIITHNMGIVADMADDVAVMYMGKIVEFGTKEDVFLNPLHPYTQALLKSVPILGNAGEDKLIPIRGVTPDPSEMPPGCAFEPRCDFATEACKTCVPGRVGVTDSHIVRCVHCIGEKLDD